MPALTHGRVKNKFGSNGFTSLPPVLRWNPLNFPFIRRGNISSSRMTALSAPGSRKKDLTSGTVGSSAAAKRAWQRQSHYTAKPSSIP